MAKGLFCVEKLGLTRGLKTLELVERVTERPCPCKQGKVCPLAPASEQEEAPAPPAVVIKWVGASVGVTAMTLAAGVAKVAQPLGA